MLSVDGLSHAYDTDTVVRDVSFTVEKGELIGMLGPSGCGKTTVIQAIAGHITPSAGEITLRGSVVTDAPPESRRIGVMFQRPTLYPHMTISANIEYGLRAHDIPAQDRASIVESMLELVELEEYGAMAPGSLSLGQQRRAELARVLAPEPDLLLLDEPLTSLDRELRERLLVEIARIQRETGVTTVFVTHDQEEAMAVADRLIVMNDGTIAGSDTPRSLYTNPPTPFVASFLGRSVEVPGLVEGASPPIVRVGNLSFTPERSAESLTAGMDVTCYIRPEQLRWIADPDKTAPSGTVREVIDRGRYGIVRVNGEHGRTFDIESRSPYPSIGDTVGIEIIDQDVAVF